MSGVLERTLGILELLASHAGGLPVGTIAGRLDMPPSAAHRLLNDLARMGYVRQDKAQGDYALTIKLAALGLGFLARSGITDVAQPVLDRLAAESRELVRLSVIDGDALVWVGVAQGATGGLRYDPAREQGVEVHLAASAGGNAWLATMSDDAALMAVSRQGLRADLPGAGGGAPRTAMELLARLTAARERGYAVAVDSYIAGMAAMAVPVRHPDGTVIGCLSIAGPSVRLDEAQMAGLAQPLVQAAAEIGAASQGSRLLTTPPARKASNA